MKWKLILFSLGYFVVVSNGNCLSGSVKCHEAASCQNVSDVPTCVCDPWSVGDGVSYCYGFCNRDCGKNNVCRMNAIGYSCLCVSPSPECLTAPPPPTNVRVTWRSSNALTFAWNYVVNAYHYRAVLRNSSWTSRLYSTNVPVAGFAGLASNSTYNLTVVSAGANGKESGTKSTLANVLTAGASSTTNRDICDDAQGCRGRANKCSSGKHKCHPEATCTDTRRGYRCTCHNGYVGNGTHCIGVCETCPNGNCLPNQFGSTCFCRNTLSKCHAPNPPSGIRLVEQRATSLIFKWNPSSNAASYQASLYSSQHPHFQGAVYSTEVPVAAFTGLLPGTVYTVNVKASNAKGVSPAAPSLTSATVMAGGPRVTATAETNSSIRVQFAPVPRASSYEIKYYTDPNQVLRLNTTKSSVLLKNLTIFNEYNIQVFVNYARGRSNGSEISTVFLANMCNGLVCHRNASCSSGNRCVCNYGFIGSGTDCQKLFEIPFKLRLAAGVNHSEATVRNQFQRFINRYTVVDFFVGTITKDFILFDVFSSNKDISLTVTSNETIFLGNAESLRDICLSKQVSGFHFAETQAGSVQVSNETCHDETPIASVPCVSEVIRDNYAFILGAQFVADNLTEVECPEIPVIKDAFFNLSEAEIKVPVEAIEQALAQLNITDIKPVVTVTRGAENISEQFPSDFRVNAVITIDIGENTTIQNLETPVRIVNTLENTSYGQTEPLTPFLNTRVVQRCVFWDEEAQEWSGEGCCLNNFATPPTCECNHLTSFAILVSTVEVPANLALIVVSVIGCALSIVGLAATFLVLIFNREARAKIPNIIQMHFTCSLFFTYVIFVFGVTRVENYVACTFIAALLHYVFLVSWIWIGIYSNRLYLALVKVFHQTGPNFMKQACLFAYGTPLLIVGFNVAITVGYFDRNHRNDELCNPDDPITRVSDYRAENMCWLNNYSLYFGFLIFVGVVLLHNIVILVLVSRKIFHQQHIRSTKTKRSRVSELFSAVGLSFTLGVTWLFGFLMLLSTNAVYNLIMSWLFAIFTASQGFAVWYVTCVKRKDLRQFWLKPVTNFFIAIAVKFGCYERPAKTSVNGAGNGFVTSATYSTTHSNKEWL